MIRTLLILFLVFLQILFATASSLLLHASCPFPQFPPQVGGCIQLCSQTSPPCPLVHPHVHTQGHTPSLPWTSFYWPFWLGVDHASCRSLFWSSADTSENLDFSSIACNTLLKMSISHRSASSMAIVIVKCPPAPALYLISEWWLVFI